VFLVTSLSISLRAQGPIVIDENARVILHGNVHPWARLQHDVGRTDPNLRIQRMTLLLVPSRPQQRNWRRAQEAGTRTGGSDKQLQAVTRWLRSHGLAIQRADAGRRFSVKFSGTVAQVEEAFRVEIHDYLVDGKAYYANSNHPSIPRALSGLVAGVNSLDDFPASGNTHGETVLHHFTGTLNAPAAGGITDSAGNLYGTTAGGGPAGLGTVFKLGTKGNETVLYNFTGANGDGANPNAGLVLWFGITVT
jgi:trimeric autotransporter adhesin